MFSSICPNDKDVGDWDQKAIIKYYKPLMEKNYCQIGKSEIWYKLNRANRTNTTLSWTIICWAIVSTTFHLKNLSPKCILETLDIE